MKNSVLKLFKKFLNKIGITPYVYYTYKYNKPLEIKKKLLGNKEILIFDVGANDGRTIDLYKSNFSNCTIFSFEPTPEIFEKLKRRTSKYNNVKIFKEALTNYVGVTEFHLNHSGFTNSILPSGKVYNETEGYNTIETINVDTNTLDNFCKLNSINFIDLLKIDVQGADLQVLKGAINLLKNKKIEMIYVEVEFVELYENQALFHDISSFLIKFNYKLYSIYNISMNKKGQMIYGDALFIKN